MSSRRQARDAPSPSHPPRAQPRTLNAILSIKHLPDHGTQYNCDVRSLCQQIDGLRVLERDVHEQESVGVLSDATRKLTKELLWLDENWRKPDRDGVEHIHWLNIVSQLASEGYKETTAGRPLTSRNVRADSVIDKAAKEIKEIRDKHSFSPSAEEKAARQAEREAEREAALNVRMIANAIRNLPPSTDRSNPTPVSPRPAAVPTNQTAFNPFDSVPPYMSDELEPFPDTTAPDWEKAQPAPPAPPPWTESQGGDRGRHSLANTGLIDADVGVRVSWEFANYEPWEVNDIVRSELNRPSNKRPGKSTGNGAGRGPGTINMDSVAQALWDNYHFGQVNEEQEKVPFLSRHIISKKNSLERSDRDAAEARERAHEEDGTLLPASAPAPGPTPADDYDDWVRNFLESNGGSRLPDSTSDSASDSSSDSDSKYHYRAGMKKHWQQPHHGAPWSAGFQDDSLRGMMETAMRQQGPSLHYSMEPAVQHVHQGKQYDLMASISTRMSELVGTNISRGQIEYYTSNRWGLKYPDIYGTTASSLWTPVASELLHNTIKFQLGSSSIEKMPDDVWVRIADAYWNNVNMAARMISTSGNRSVYSSIPLTELDRRLDDIRTHGLKNHGAPSTSAQVWNVEGYYSVMETKPPPPDPGYPRWGSP